MPPAESGTLIQLLEMSIFYIRTVQRGPAAARQQGGGRVLRGGAQQLLRGRHQVPRRLLPPQEAGHLRGALATPRVRAIYSNHNHIIFTIQVSSTQ